MRVVVSPWEATCATTKGALETQRSIETHYDVMSILKSGIKFKLLGFAAFTTCNF